MLVADWNLFAWCLGMFMRYTVDTVVINSITMVFTGGRVVAGSEVEGRSTIELLTTACTIPDHSSLCTSDCSTLCTSLALKTTMDKISMSLVTEPLLKTKTCLITILKPKERAASLKFPHQGENVRFFIWAHLVPRPNSGPFLWPNDTIGNSKSAVWTCGH